MPVPHLLERTVWSTVRRPRFEGCNVGTWIGFKHVMYLVEEGILELLRTHGLAPAHLLDEHALCIEIVDTRLRLTTGIRVDDVVRIEVCPLTRPADEELVFAVTLVRADDVKLASGRSRVVLRVDRRFGEPTPPPESLAPFTRREIDRHARTSGQPGGEIALAAGAGEEDVRRALAPPGANAFVWPFRVPYFYCHYTERLQHSGYVRLMEEAVDRFLADRGISIATLLRERRWIPVVTQAHVEMLREVLMEETLYTVFTVEEIMKEITYTARVDSWVRRGDRLIQTAAGSITHAYIGFAERTVGSTIVTFDRRVLEALAGRPEPLP